jgi:hypothetical protein
VLTARSGGRAALAAVRPTVLAAAAGLILCSVASAAFGRTTRVVVSGSMAPAVRTGDIVAASLVAPQRSAG